MATKKQQKKRRKRMVHGVVVDEEQDGTTAPRKEPKAPRDRSKPVTGRNGRELPEPSLRRSLRRGGIVFASLAVLMYIVSPDDGNRVFVAVLQAALGTAFFIPFDYFLTRFVHGRVAARQQR